jgi:hypothetical protein
LYYEYTEYNYEFFENECDYCVVEYSTYLVAIKAGFSEVIVVTSNPHPACNGFLTCPLMFAGSQVGISDGDAS